MTKRTIIWALLFALLCSAVVGLALSLGAEILWASRQGRLGTFPFAWGVPMLFLGWAGATIATGFLTAGRAKSRPLLHSMIGAWPFAAFWLFIGIHHDRGANVWLVVAEAFFLIASVAAAFLGGLFFILRQRRRKRRAAARLHTGTVDVF